MSPLDFLMRHYRGGQTASIRIATRHAMYCIGCCWALMVLLVVAGTMSLPWVLGISLIVFAEKLLPGGELTARVIGWVLIAAACVMVGQHAL
jgi:predicted metal-binding membrane protein